MKRREEVRREEEEEGGKVGGRRGTLLLYLVSKKEQCLHAACATKEGKDRKIATATSIPPHNPSVSLLCT